MYSGPAFRRRTAVHFLRKGFAVMQKSQKYATIDAYIAAQPDEIRGLLQEMRAAVKRAAPHAEERMSWGMPTFRLGENLVHFAAAARHIGFHPTPSAITAFAGRLEGYKTGKVTVQFPCDRPIPYGLVEEMTRFRIREVMNKDR